jgi:hypothetical protein
MLTMPPLFVERRIRVLRKLRLRSPPRLIGADEDGRIARTNQRVRKPGRLPGSSSLESIGD